MTYHARHIGHIDTYAQLLREGWTVLGESYPPISPSVDISVWLRCPADCADCARPAVSTDINAACRCAPGEG